MTGPRQSEHLADGEEQPGDIEVGGEGARGEGRGGDHEADGRDQRIAPRTARADPVSDPAAEPGARDAADQHDRAVIPADVCLREAEAAVEEARQPEDQPVAEDRAEGGAEGEQPEAGIEEKDARHRGCRRGLRGRRIGRRRIEAAAGRLWDQQLDQQSGRKAGEADDQEGHSPGKVGREPPAEEHAQSRSDRDPERIESERPGALFLRIIIGDERISGGDSPGLADRDAHSGDDELAVGLDEAAGGGEQAPDRDRGGDDVDPALAIGEPGDRQSDRRVEDSEGNSEVAERAVAEPKLRLDRYRQDSDDLAVDEVEDVGEEQDEEDSAAHGRPLDPAPDLNQRKLNPTDRNTCRGFP